MPHGHCYQWLPRVLWLHVISDSLIALAYFSIPAALFYFVKKRKDIEFRGVVFLFAVFITACGMNHLLAIYTIWIPQYFGEGIAKAITAVASIGTSVAIWYLMPVALRIPSFDQILEKDSELQDAKLRLQFGQQLEERERKMRTVLDAVPTGVLMVNQQGLITLCNLEVERMLRYRSGELVGKSVDSLVPLRFRMHHPEFRAAFSKAPLRRQMGSGRDLFALTKDGAEIPVEIGLNPVVLNDGNYVIASIVDISARKTIEERLQKTNDELAQKNSEMEQFVYTVSHDLKSPLVTAASFIGFLKEDVENRSFEDIEDSLARIERANLRMRELIDDLLDLSRSGRLDEKREDIPIKELIQVAKDNLSTEIKKVSLKIEDKTDDLNVCVDRARMIQVFENLLTNVLKYASIGPNPRLIVQAETVPGGTRICFQDFGPGIDPAYHHKIFGLFQRLNSEVEGTGVGLAIVSRIVEAHGGRVWVESKVGAGSRFFIFLKDIVKK